MSKNVEFIDQLCELMGGDRFFLCDQYCQDDLFEMQDKIEQFNKHFLSIYYQIWANPWVF